MDLEWALRAFFLGSTVALLITNRIPPLRRRFVEYGPRLKRTCAEAPSRTFGPGPASGTTAGSDGGAPLGILDGWAAAEVPHAWFKHFYLFSVVLSAFWAGRLLSSGSAPRRVLVAGHVEREHPASGMSLGQVALAWAILCVQGCRRLYECLAFDRPSTATMWVGHWVLGLAYYGALSMAVWVEGRPALGSVGSAWDVVRLRAPSMRTLLLVPVFLLASGVQHDCHAHLARLRKYSLPTHPLFRSIVCPHYTAECVIHLALCIVAAPRGHWANGTLLTGLILAATNLGITADNTRSFYAERFGHRSIDGRWRMIPYVW